MIDHIKQIIEEIRSNDLPKDIDKAIKKCPDILTPCSRIGWYSKDDLDFHKTEPGMPHPREEPPYQGYLVQLHDCGDVSDNLEWDQCMVVMDTYPVEKCNCEPTWISLVSLLDNDDCIEIVVLKKK